MASETWSAILSGWPSVTDSEVKRNLSDADKVVPPNWVRIASLDGWRNPVGSVVSMVTGEGGAGKGLQPMGGWGVSAGKWRRERGESQGAGARNQESGVSCECLIADSCLIAAWSVGQWWVAGRLEAGLAAADSCRYCWRFPGRCRGRGCWCGTGGNWCTSRFRACGRFG